MLIIDDRETTFNLKLFKVEVAFREKPLFVKWRPLKQTKSKNGQRFYFKNF